ncbi:MAG: alpha/beta fold hydrolase [Xanthomonadales bacterium]|nr:alpha/beta fold hydrolase [Xanthomonadales bacterium]
MPHVLVNIRNDDACHVIGQLSITAPDTLILFVHGWGGNATDTWAQIDQLLKKSPPDGVTFDALYYGYESIVRSAGENAGQLLAFLDALLKDPADCYRRLVGKVMMNARSGFEYKRIVICCHSLGAPVVRRALLDAWSANAEDEAAAWMGRVRMVLFAPAHFGARPTEVVRQLGGVLAWLVLVEAVANAVLPSLRDLNPESVFLEQLSDQSRAMLEVERFPKQLVRAYRVYWAPNDPIVMNRQFHGDRPPETVSGATHTSLCKADHSEAAAYIQIKEAMS